MSEKKCPTCGAAWPWPCEKPGCPRALVESKAPPPLTMLGYHKMQAALEMRQESLRDTARRSLGLLPEEVEAGRPLYKPASARTRPMTQLEAAGFIFGRLRNPRPALRIPAGAPCLLRHVRSWRESPEREASPLRHIYYALVWAGVHTNEGFVLELDAEEIELLA